MKNALLAIVMVAGVASVASGQTVSWVADGSGEVFGETGTFNFWLLQVDVPTGSDWLATDLGMDLTAGSFGYDDGTSLPNATGGRGFTYDVYAVAVDEATGGRTPGGTLLDNELRVGWFDTSNSGEGLYTIARLALTPDAAGDISVLETKFAAQGDPLTVDSAAEYTISNGEIVPEPMTMSLLAFGGLALLRRKRK